MLADTDVPSVSSAQLVRAREPNDLSFMLYISIFIYMDTFNKLSDQFIDPFFLQCTTWRAPRWQAIASSRNASRRPGVPRHLLCDARWRALPTT
ncbi:hypothetical protein A167_03065 [Alcanivorax sp. S71-1-4]|nr:hypothetical protein A167_03065 [Alcanivorax sp. S71-1-4]